MTMYKNVKENKNLQRDVSSLHLVVDYGDIAKDGHLGSAPK